ncbi:MAG: hypothetical protein WBL55_21260, partial [Xanthobacteraceae bacterium]
APKGRWSRSRRLKPSATDIFRNATVRRYRRALSLAYSIAVVSNRSGRESDKELSRIGWKLLWYFRSSREGAI